MPFFIAYSLIFNIYFFQSLKRPLLDETVYGRSTIKFIFIFEHTPPFSFSSLFSLLKSRRSFDQQYGLLSQSPTCVLWACVVFPFATCASCKWKASPSEYCPRF